MAKNKATAKQGLQEDRTRVTIFLPAHNTNDIRAIRKVVQYLHDQKKSKTCRVTGFTTSGIQNSPFTGVWWSPDQRNWIPEKVTLLILDYEKRLDDPDLENSLRRLKQAIHDSYTATGSKQEEIWVIATPVMRFA